MRSEHPETETRTYIPAANGEMSLKRKIISLGLALLAAAWTLSGCAGKKTLNRYQTTFLELFDTVTTITGYAESEDAFRETAGAIYAEMENYDRLYDIYHEYPETVNLCTVNAHPGETLAVDQRIIDLLVFAREVDAFSGHRTNITLGSVLSLWHNAREAGISDPENAFLPGDAELRAAAEHSGFQFLEIDEDNRTVRLTDNLARLDVGALAKGYAVQRMAEKLPEGYLLSVGGNVVATGAKPDGASWVIGIQDPDGGGEGYLCRVNLTRGAVVTSGDYQRYYVVDGKTYHHIIDPETLYPGDRWRAVTVISDDSGLGDALSTSLFLMTMEEGQTLLDRYGAEAMWIQKDGTEYFSPGFRKYIKE